MTLGWNDEVVVCLSTLVFVLCVCKHTWAVIEEKAQLAPLFVVDGGPPATTLFINGYGLFSFRVGVCQSSAAVSLVPCPRTILANGALLRVDLCRGKHGALCREVWFAPGSFAAVMRSLTQPTFFRACVRVADRTYVDDCVVAIGDNLSFALSAACMREIALYTPKGVHSLTLKWIDCCVRPLKALAPKTHTT